jgi:chromosome segregation ATPase
MSDKPREWWLQCYYPDHVLPQNRTQYAYDKEQMDYHAGYAEESRREFYAKHVHVIEYSAYTQERERADRLEAEVELWKDKHAIVTEGFEKLDEECQRLEAELAEVRRDDYRPSADQVKEYREKNDVGMHAAVEALKAKEIKKLQAEVAELKVDLSHMTKLARESDHAAELLSQKLAAAEAERDNFNADLEAHMGWLLREERDHLRALCDRLAEALRKESDGGRVMYAHDLLAEYERVRDKK